MCGEKLTRETERRRFGSDRLPAVPRLIFHAHFNQTPKRGRYNGAMFPAFLRPFFWDVDVESFDPRAYPEYTIERILELGTREAIAWLEEQFSEQQIKAVIQSDKRLSPKSATFWALVYRIPPQEVAALR